MSKTTDTVEGIHNIRDMALRLTLGNSEARALRAIVVELCGVLTGTGETHPDVDLAGARFPAPTVGAVAAAPGQAIAAGVVRVLSAPLPRVAGPGPRTLAEAAALVEARKAAAAPPAPPAPPATTEAAGDPAGESFLDRLAHLADEENEDDAHTEANGQPTQ